MMDYEIHNGISAGKTLRQAWSSFFFLRGIMHELLDCGRLLFDGSLLMSCRAQCSFLSPREALSSSNEYAELIVK